MDLLFLRHAEAIELGSDGITQDNDRYLSNDGIKKMKRAAEGMRQLNLNLDVILTSPLLRAIQTAEIVAKEFNIENKIQVSNHLSPNGDPSVLVSEIKKQYDKAQQLMLVGHEPDLSCLVSYLLSGVKNVSINLKKGSLIYLTVSKLVYGQCAMLNWFLTCRQLVNLR